MKKKLLLLLLVCTYSFAQQNNNFRSFTLDNGLKVILDRDSLQTEVFGVVAVNAGSRDEEPNATGMAHYLEHMLFKGTKDLGTANWEAEKPHYERIIQLYDELQSAKTKKEEKEIYKQINAESQKQSKYVITNEFSKLIQQMGGVGLNATTSFDVTRYFNTFPPNQLERWLDLYSHRFINPVFRLFQTELETVYEEKNRAEDNPFGAYSTALLSAIYGDHPYGRPIIGKTEHLKKPWMSKMIEFYNKWYVPENMVLVLSGNFDLDKAETLIKDKFGRWKKKNAPKQKEFSIKQFKGEEKVRVKLTPYLRAAKVYNGPKDGFSKEGVALNIASEILNNSANTGLLDRLSLDGSIMFGGASYEVLKDGSTFSIHYAPVFDPNQRRQLSFSSAEDLIETRMKVLEKGSYSLALLDQIKENMLKDLALQMESPQFRAFSMVDYFINDKNPQDFFNLEETIKSITKQDISDAVKKYINKNYLAFYSNKGEADKEKVTKPEIDPIKPEKHEPSTYANKFLDIPSVDAPHNYVNFATDVKRGILQDKVNLYYIPNKKNDVFTMNIVFHAGTFDIPKLEYAITLINNSGIISQFKPDELRKEFGKLGVTYSFSVNKDYTTIKLQGKENSLGAACRLLSKLMILPEIEEKALDRILGNIYYTRSMEAKKQDPQFAALVDYIRHGEKSDYIDRLSFKEITALRPSELVGELNKAISYEADVHYHGKIPVSSLADTLLSNLAFVANRIEGKSPQKKEDKTYDKNTIYVINNNDITQSKVFLYVPSEKIPLQKIPLVQAFNQYFSGGFNGLVLKEIREYRSLAYTASAHFATPELPTWNSSLMASLGTQADKTNEAVSLFIDLLKDMPENEEQMKGVRDYLVNSSYLARPSDRNLSYKIYQWELAGYNRDPQMLNVPTYKILQFKNVVDFYNQNIKGRPYVIGIVGPIKDIDLKELEKLGDVNVIDAKKLFSKD